jgi:hypothetical protein
MGLILYSLEVKVFMTFGMSIMTVNPIKCIAKKAMKLVVNRMGIQTIFIPN